MTSSTTQTFPRRLGMTLIELLVAIAIGVVLVAIVTTLLRTVSRTVSGQQERARGPHAATRALTLLRDDLTAAILPVEDPACVFTVAPSDTAAGDSARSELAFCALQSGPPQEQVDWAVPWRITYRLAAVAGHDSALVRISAPLSGPGSLDPATTNVLLDAAAEFAVTVYDGSDWQPAWPPEKPGTAQPRLVRVAIVPADAGGQRFSTEIFLPAGNSVSSTVVRTAAPAATPEATPADAPTSPLQ